MLWLNMSNNTKSVVWIYLELAHLLPSELVKELAGAKEGAAWAREEGASLTRKQGLIEDEKSPQ